MLCFGINIFGINIIEQPGRQGENLIRELQPGIKFKEQPPKHRLNQKGNILVTTLLILLVMNLLGIGLANLATRQWNMADYKIIDSEVLHTTDNCSKDVIAWFAMQTRTPATIATFNADATSNLTQGQMQTTPIANKLSGYSYSCNVTYLTGKATASERNVGGEVGNSGSSYSLTGNQVLKDYYTISSTGYGPKNASKVINTVISVEY